MATLTQKYAAFVWEKPQQDAFDNLKSIITSVPALAYFDNNRETVMNVDASGTGLGAMIIQEGKPVAFGSKTLTTWERRYANIEWDCSQLCGEHRNFTHMCIGAK